MHFRYCASDTIVLNFPIVNRSFGVQITFGWRRGVVVIQDLLLAGQSDLKMKEGCSWKIVSSCSALVAVMKSTDLRDLHHCTEFTRLDGSRFGCIFVQRQMGSRMLVILEVRLQDAAQAALG